MSHKYMVTMKSVSHNLVTLASTYLKLPIEVAQGGLKVGIVLRHIYRSAGWSQIGGVSFERTCELADSRYRYLHRRVREHVA